MLSGKCTTNCKLSQPFTYYEDSKTHSVQRVKIQYDVLTRYDIKR
jgi:hypothetical protein